MPCLIVSELSLEIEGSFNRGVLSWMSIFKLLSTDFLTKLYIALADSLQRSPALMRRMNKDLIRLSLFTFT
jgi:hypothetical protein